MRRGKGRREKGEKIQVKIINAIIIIIITINQKINNKENRNSNCIKHNKINIIKGIHK